MTQRRDFIKKSLIGGAGLAIGGMGFSAKSYGSILGANDRINVAVIGIRGRGVSHIDAWCELKESHNVRLKTLCDTDEQFFDPRSKTVLDKTGIKPTTEWDMRKVLDDKEIDIVSFATPNHWHALGTIWACQAGKHVYVEKPASHNIWEGRKMIEASRKYNKRIQVGFQNRSIPNVMEAMKFLHGGGIGEIYMARGLCVKPRDSFGIAKDSTPPASLHYDRWLGPAPYRPYNEKRGHYNWHWFWDTGNGDTGNQGPHQFDIARWGLNKNEHPVSVFSSGGIYGIDRTQCEQETPNTQLTIAKYNDGKILEFETRGRYSNSESGLGIKIGNIFYGSEGYLEIDGSTWRAYRNKESDPFAGSKVIQANASETLTGSSNTEHFVNFLDAIKSGNNETLHCDILDGHYSSAVPFLANISYRLGREIRFMGNSEKCINDPAADAMLTRKYRSPYVVPSKV
ncbi:MAG: dehydrogenase [Sphingobacteriales bacterium 17-39-43]|uniref:Gfo/Idh/MocA family protein n=1 Tax=Daejeonella sp. TaxID=2805397 RepID=UPI000BD074C5|nr:Gfo/Idh/MocA family oxidoreductase [Daejeonella sp.]OYZ30831.1 MAG: dehydrogenase [Sphingobacteriales bacterium 16-39-50]OZA23549.1 MAG: dehydrogenase [Sphingobacteriales bacterium 17-39-43]HQS05974.1 Gfo/Idh/MocA family oxidoreductase [Daejeonella sp.]HQS50913.1 Gfo/Idh/MocA family oxidoreductase [Daejeonella sp.]HQT23745.1 Gfo/Idh/MocA family oxidoreductase [Daejeonella sp.]